jgi:hypothetical protein
MKRAIDFEQSLGNGRVLIYQGHPCYCSNTEPHEPHRFEYTYLDANGNRTEGFYDCKGEPSRLAIR